MRLSLVHGVGAAASALLTSTATLVCCVLPAVMVALGAGASLAGLVASFPQLVWLSERKGLVFGVAAAVLAISAWMLWRARRLPCPTDPIAAKACSRMRRMSQLMFFMATTLYSLGAIFAFVLPLLG